MGYQTKELADLAGVTIRTLRYYDKIGLLVPTREENGHRSYSQKNYLRLLIILELKDLGLALTEITDFLSNQVDSFDTLLLVRKQVLIEGIRKKQAQLQEVEQLLAKEISSPEEFENMALDQLIFQRNPYRQEAKKIWQDKLTKQELREYVMKSEVTSTDFNKHYEQLVKVQNKTISAKEVQETVANYVTFLKKIYQSSINQEDLLIIADSYQKNTAAMSYLSQYGPEFGMFLSQAMIYYAKNNS